MKSFLLSGVLILGLSGSTAVSAEQGKSAEPADKKSFELTPVSPPSPALKYQLMFDDAGNRLPGNAAILYLDSVLLLGADTREKIQNAYEAYNTDRKVFGSIADSIDATSVLKEVELAGRRVDCRTGWEEYIGTVRPVRASEDRGSLIGAM